MNGGAVKDALAEVQAAVKSPAGDARADAWLIIGDCYSTLTQRDREVKAYETAVKRDGANVEAAYKLANDYKDDGKDAPASQLLDHALKLAGDKTPFAAEGWFLSGELHKRLGDKGTAKAAYEQYLKIAPPDAKDRASVQRSLDELARP
jgi:Tfp pilus assembly protein PilF